MPNQPMKLSGSQPKPRSDSGYGRRPLQSVSVELPRNLVVISDNQRTTLAASVVARMETVGYVNKTSDLAFAANLDGSRSFTVTVSFREDQAALLQPIADRIGRSLKRQ